MKFRFSTVLLILILYQFFASSLLFSQDITEEEYRKLEEVRQSLIERGFLQTDILQSGISEATLNDAVIVNSVYDNKSRGVATSGSRATDFRPDGRRMYILGRSSENIIEYHLQTPWDISGASYARELDISSELGTGAQEGSVAHAVFIRKSDGNKMWVFNRTEIWEYSLSTPWDITTATNTGYRSFSDDIVRGHDIDFRPNGKTLYIDDRLHGAVFQYNLSTPWDVSTATLTSDLNIQNQQQEVRGIQLNSDGTKLFLMDTGRQEVLEYNISTPYNINTASFVGAYNVSTQSQSSDPRGITFNTEFDGFYVTDASQDKVYQFRVRYADSNLSTISAGNSKVIANGSQTSRITVVLRDSNGVRLSNIRTNLSSNSSSAVINAVNRRTNSNGEATFDVSNSAAESVTFTASATNNVITQTATVNFVTISASASIVSSNREKVIANGTAVSRITVTVRDADGDNLEGVRINLSANSSNAQIRNIRRDTDSNGEALFEVSSSVIEPVRFTASGLGTTINQTSTVRFVGVDPDESNMLVNRQKVLANGSAAGRVFVIARDEDGDLLEGVRISLSANSNNVEIININRDTDSNGEAVFEVRNSTAEQVRFTATSMGQTISQTRTILFVTVDPQLSSADVNPENVQANGSEESRITVLVRDEDGDFLEGAEIRLQAVSGSSEINNPEQLSNQDGEAEFRVTNSIPEIIEYRIIAEGIELPDRVAVGFVPVAPVVLSANQVETRRFQANWELVPGADRYLIDVATDSSFSNLVSVYDSFDAGNVTSLTIENGIEPGKRYLYRVRATISDLIGANSEPSQLFTFPDTPQATAANNRNALVFRANWSEAEGAGNYRLDVARDPNFENYVDGYRDVNVGNSTSSEVSGLTPGQSYYYRVRSEAGPRISPNSNTIQTSTLTISPEQSVIASSQLRVLANGNQSNQIEIIVKSEEGEPLEGLRVQLTPQNGNVDIQPTESVTNEDGKAQFGVTSNDSGEVTFEVTAEGFYVGELSVEFIQDDGVLVLGNNFPNPFLNRTLIPITIPRRMDVRIEVYNSLGVPVQTILDESVETGYYEVPFDGRGLAAGVYFYRMIADGELKTGKMVLVH
ncbi:MAG: Ig-like domain-containing protein [Balneolaceae bacterium]|nr:Ig-like domain-containing protein [Balneolaceae bacterium]